MPRVSPRPRRVLSTLLAGGLTAAVLATFPVAAPASPADGAPGEGLDLTLTEPGELLDAPASGRKAIRALGDHLATVAARHGMTSAELRRELRHDSSLNVDSGGRLFYIDGATHDLKPPTARAETVNLPREVAMADGFSLHSKPGARLTIYLDFNGETVTNTEWNQTTEGLETSHPSWDPAGDGPTFSAAEQELVKQVWAMVAEDFDPFDVNVTTADPGADGLERSSASDTTYGMRALITPSANAAGAICDDVCTGVAYLDVFADQGSTHQPAWVFPHKMFDWPRYIADTVSHEVGHNLGLKHDGGASAYYAGHGAWAPIMGSGGPNQPIVQWSQGSYPSADNNQNDLSIIAGYLGVRADEASGSIATPSALPAGQAWITAPQDVDAYALGACTAGSTVTVSPAALSPNLDIHAELFDSAGNSRGASNPPSGVGDQVTASGMGATLTVPASGSGWVVRIDGVGQGTWNGGYDDYGSLGSYTVTAPGCSVLLGTEPGTPTNVAASTTSDSLTLTWNAPTGANPVEGYAVTLSGTDAVVRLGADARSHTFTGLSANTSYSAAVSATNSTGSSLAATVSATTQGPQPVAPSAPRNLRGSHDAGTNALVVTWDPPAAPGSHPVQAYGITVEGRYLGDVGGTRNSASITATGPLAAGNYTVEVTAISAAGTSPAAAVEITVGRTAPITPAPTTAPGASTNRPARVAKPRVRVRGRKVVIRWRAPAANGRAIKRYRVDFSKAKDRSVKGKRTKLVVKRFKRGRHKVRVRAHNGAGKGAWSRWVRFRVR